MLAILIASLAQGAAEEEFRRIETALLSAPTARIKSRTVTSYERRPGHTHVRESEVLLKAGGRAFLSVRNVGEAGNSLMLLSDGAKLKMRHGTGETLLLTGREDLTAFIPGNIVRKGLPFGCANRFHELSDFKQGAEEDGASTLTYTLHQRDPWNERTSYEAKLWYEPLTCRLIKRTTRNALKRMSQTEIYSEYVLGEDIPDRTFSFPRDY